jgi:hypothetical protein
MQPRTQLEKDLVERLGLRLRPYFPDPPIDHPGIWVGNLFANLREAIRGGDKIAVSIACELIDQDPMLPFGKLIKSGLARELRRNVASLIPIERVQVIGATVRLLTLRYAPREVEDYVKLVAKFPRAEYLAQIENIEAKNPKAVHLKAVLLAARQAGHQ